MQKLIKGDEVKVLIGKDSGKTGLIEAIDIKKGKIMIMGINMSKRHVRRMNDVEGGIIEIPKPINLSNVQLVCPNCNKQTRVGIDVTKNGKIRICKKCKKDVSIKKEKGEVKAKKAKASKK